MSSLTTRFTPTLNLSNGMMAFQFCKILMVRCICIMCSADLLSNKVSRAFKVIYISGSIGGINVSMKAASGARELWESVVRSTCGPSPMW